MPKTSKIQELFTNTEKQREKDMSIIQAEIDFLNNLTQNTDNKWNRLVLKFNKERLKAFSALARSKIVLTQMKALISDNKRNSKHKSRKCKCKHKNDDKKKSMSHHSKDISLRSSRDTPLPINTSEKTSLLPRRKMSTYINPDSKNKNSDLYNYLKDKENVLLQQKTTSEDKKVTETKAIYNNCNVNSDIIVPKVSPINSKPGHLIVSQSIEDTVLPDVSLSKPSSNIKINPVTNINAYKETYARKLDILFGTTTVDDTPASKPRDPKKSYLKKYLESQCTSITPMMAKSGIHNVINIHESEISPIKYKSTHIPIPPPPTIPKRGYNSVPVSSTLKSSHTFIPKPLKEISISLPTSQRNITNKDINALHLQRSVNNYMSNSKSVDGINSTGKRVKSEANTKITFTSQFNPEGRQSHSNYASKFHDNYMKPRKVCFYNSD